MIGRVEDQRGGTWLARLAPAVDSPDPYLSVPRHARVARVFTPRRTRWPASTHTPTPTSSSLALQHSTNLNPNRPGNPPPPPISRRVPLRHARPVPRHGPQLPAREHHRGGGRHDGHHPPAPGAHWAGVSPCQTPTLRNPPHTHPHPHTCAHTTHLSTHAPHPPGRARVPLEGRCISSVVISIPLNPVQQPPPHFSHPIPPP